MDATQGEVWYDHDSTTGDYFHSGDDRLVSDGEDVEGFEAYAVPSGPGQSAAQNYWIDMGDSPTAYMAPDWIDLNYSGNGLQEVFGKWSFSLYIAARTTQSVITPHSHTPAQFLNANSIDNPGTAIHPHDPTALIGSPLNSNNLYFQQANSYWDFKFNGIKDGYLHWTPQINGLSGLLMFNNFQGDGKLVPRTTGPIVNTLLQEGEWNRSVGP